VVLLQQDGGALLFGQIRHYARHRSADFLPRDQVLDRFARRRLRRQLDQIHPLGRLGDRLAALAPNPVAAQVQRDAIQPGREFRLALEAAQSAERAEERFLADVARVFLAPDGAIREGIDRPFPAQDELVEAIQVAGPGLGDQFFVCRRHRNGAHVLLDKTEAAGFWL
jgi:phosphoglycolate phosphatase-like HAD superfamily hydrolase